MPCCVIITRNNLCKCFFVPLQVLPESLHFTLKAFSSSKLLTSWCVFSFFTSSLELCLLLYLLAFSLHLFVIHSFPLLIRVLFFSFTLMSLYFEKGKQKRDNKNHLHIRRISTTEASVYHLNCPKGDSMELHQSAVRSLLFVENVFRFN